METNKDARIDKNFKKDGQIFYKILPFEKMYMNYKNAHKFRTSKKVFMEVKNENSKRRDKKVFF